MTIEAKYSHSKSRKGFDRVYYQKNFLKVSTKVKTLKLLVISILLKNTLQSFKSMVVKGIITFSYKYITTKCLTKFEKCAIVHTITTDNDKAIKRKLSRSKNND